MKTFISAVRYNLISQIRLWHFCAMILLYFLISYIFSTHLLFKIELYELGCVVNCWDVFYASVSGPFSLEYTIAWIIWYLPFFLISLLIGNIARQELYKMPEDTLLRYKSRIIWWCGKQASVLLALFAYFLSGFLAVIGVSLFYFPFSVKWSDFLLSGDLYVYSDLFDHADSTLWFLINSPFIYLIMALITFISGISAMLFMQMVLSLKCKHSFTALLITNLTYFMVTYLATTSLTEGNYMRWVPGSQLILSAFSPFNTRSDSLGFLWPLSINLLMMLIWGLVGAFIITRIDIVRAKED